MVARDRRCILFASLLKSLALVTLLLAFAWAAEPADRPTEPKQTALPEIGVSASRGFFDQPFFLQLTSSVAGAPIRVTLDGSEPTPSNGVLAAAPLAITNTVTLRAI